MLYALIENACASSVDAELYQITYRNLLCFFVIMTGAVAKMILALICFLARTCIYKDGIDTHTKTYKYIYISIYIYIYKYIVMELKHYVTWTYYD